MNRLLLAMLFVGCTRTAAEAAPPKPVETKAAPTPAPLSFVTVYAGFEFASEMIGTAVSNVVAFDEKYKGRSIFMVATADEVLDLDGGGGYAQIAKEVGPFGVRCEAKNPGAAGLGRIKPGSVYMFGGDVVGRTKRGIVVDNCRVVAQVGSDVTAVARSYTACKPDFMRDMVKQHRPEVVAKAASVDAGILEIAFASAPDILERMRKDQAKVAEWRSGGFVPLQCSDPAVLAVVPCEMSKHPGKECSHPDVTAVVDLAR